MRIGWKNQIRLSEARLDRIERDLGRIISALGGEYVFGDRLRQMLQFIKTEHFDMVLASNKHERRLEAIEKAHAPHCPKCKQQLPEVL